MSGGLTNVTFGPVWLANATALCLSQPGHDKACLSELGSLIAFLIASQCDVQMLLGLAEAGATLEQSTAAEDLFYQLAAVLSPSAGGGIASARNVAGVPCLAYSGLLPQAASQRAPPLSEGDVVGQCAYAARLGCCAGVSALMRSALEAAYSEGVPLLDANRTGVRWADFQQAAAAATATLAGHCSAVNVTITSGSCFAIPSDFSLQPPPAMPKVAGGGSAGTQLSKGGVAAIAIVIVLSSLALWCCCYLRLRRRRAAARSAPSGAPLRPGTRAYYVSTFAMAER
jgi:hypothetical protein